MKIASKADPIILIIGDIAVFLLSLWLTLFVRYHEIPSHTLFYSHLWPFSLIFLACMGVYFVAGLYEKHTSLFQKELTGTLAAAHVTNSIIAVLFFYFVPVFGITPKTNLLIYLVVSYFLFILWRRHVFLELSARERRRALLIGSGREMNELAQEVRSNPSYGLHFVSVIDLETMGAKPQDIVQAIQTNAIDTVVLDLRHEKLNATLPELYELIFSRVRFIDMHRMYEEIFDRVPLSLLNYHWFLENISTAPKSVYDLLKRLMDIVVSTILGVVALLMVPFVYLLYRLSGEDGKGPLLVAQERVGRNGKLIHIYKYRTMLIDDRGDAELKKKNRPTRFGPFLRALRIDELPQLWNVVRGDLSLIGPRPELPRLASQYERDIEHYRMRHSITPGLSGWAQLYQKDPPKRDADIEKTREKLSYDLYYIKNHSFILDVKIALKTVKKFISGT